MTKSITEIAGRAVLAFGLAGGLLAGGQAFLDAHDTTTNQATCTQQITPVLGLATVCENYADSSWGGDF